MDWDDARLLLTVKRSQTFRAAAQHLGVSETTVSRRVARLEKSIGVTLLERTDAGSLHVTAIGQRLADAAEVAEREFAQVVPASGVMAPVTLRLTSVPLLINRLVAPALASRTRADPTILWELIPTVHDLSMTRREADLALRLGRPRHGGGHVMGRRIGSLPYALYGPADGPFGSEHRLPMIHYDDQFAHLPQAVWMKRYAQKVGWPSAHLRVADAETLIEAVAAGAGVAALPGVIAEADPRLHALSTRSELPPPVRDVWLLNHRVQQHAAWMQPTAAFLKSLFRADPATRMTA